jgi:hypothetical protein
VSKLRLLLLASALLAIASPVLSRELSGVNMPDRAQVAGKSLTLNGMGVRKATFLKVKVYVAGLYLETTSADAAFVIASVQTKRLVLQFVRDVTRDQIVEAWEEGFKKNGGKDLAPLRARIQKLDAWMADFRPRDTLTFTCVPGSGVRVDVRGTLAGMLPGDDFARALFAIWLGPEPPNADLKAGLLGQK